MRRSRGLRVCLLIGLMLVGASTFNVGVAAAQQQDGFIPIDPTKSNKTIVLKGNRLTIQEIVDIARYGAKVRIAKSHQDYMNRAYNLIIEASRPGRKAELRPALEAFLEAISRSMMVPRSMSSRCMASSMRSISWRRSARSGAGFSADMGLDPRGRAPFFGFFGPACHHCLRDRFARLVYA